MLVDLVELRVQGVKRSPQEIAASTPWRGVLSLSSDRPGWTPNQRSPPLLAGIQAPDSIHWLLPPLDRARVVKIRAGALLVLGMQEVRSSRRLIEIHPQAWWCRIVAPQPPAPTTPGRPARANGITTAA